MHRSRSDDSWKYVRRGKGETLLGEKNMISVSFDVEGVSVSENGFFRRVGV